MKPKVLLVDDADSVREALARMLAARYQVTTARDASEALELARSRAQFEVVVSDYDMPGEDGLRLLERLHGELPEAIGILLTGAPDPALAVAALQDGHVFRLLVKPCSYEQLSAAIEAALTRQRELAALADERERLSFTNQSLLRFNELLEERVECHARALLRLNQLALALNQAGSLRRIAQLAAAATSELLDGRGAHVQLWDLDADGSSVQASVGPEMSARMQRVSVRTSEGEVGEIVVDAGARAGRELTRGELSLLEALGATIAAAAYNELRRRERDRAHHALILSLARLSEARDNETGRHLERVAAYCQLIAQGLRADGKHTDLLDDEWIDDLVRSSPMHDIGKVGIPDSILLKPAKLSPEEWEIMKTHAELGASTIDLVLRDYGRHRILSMGRDICRCHHEKWDGSGYPRGLAGTAIPLEARILSLADVYDALTSVRPYKQAWSHARALEWIRAGNGTHFDPEIVASFVVREAQFDAIRARLADASHEAVLELITPRT